MLAQPAYRHTAVPVWQQRGQRGGVGLHWADVAAVTASPLGVAAAVMVASSFEAAAVAAADTVPCRPQQRTLRLIWLQTILLPQHLTEEGVVGLTVEVGE